MIRRLLGFGSPNAEVINGKPARGAAADVPLRPVGELLPVNTQRTAQLSTDLDLQAILSSDFKRLPFPAGLTSENGCFLLVEIDSQVIVLRRQDVASTAMGYTWPQRANQTHRGAKLLDVPAETMRHLENKGIDVARTVGSGRNNNSQQQGFDLVAAALAADASDIHIDIDEKGDRSPSVLIRFRVHGDLDEFKHYTDSASVSVFQEVNRALFQNEKTSSDHEKNTSLLGRSAGRFWSRLTLPVKKAELRYETDTTSTGSTTNIRILSYEGKPTLSTDLVGLGFSPSQSELILRGYSAPHGLLLSMGPTGAGKTSTVAAALSMNANAHRQHRIGMEQPPEISIPYMVQLAFAEDSFADAFKGAMRLDPDLIYPGEILNDVVATLAIQAAMTGHLVPATLHANNVATGLRRLVGDRGMRIPREDLCADDMLQLAMFQTLLPTLCTVCREPAVPYLLRVQRTALEDLEIDPDGMYVRFQGKHNNCSECGGRGIGRRTVLAEVVRPSGDFTDALLNHGVREAMEVHRGLRHTNYANPNQDGKNAFDHGLYKASIGMICTLQLLGQYDVLSHPQVMQRAKQRQLAGKSVVGA